MLDWPAFSRDSRLNCDRQLVVPRLSSRSENRVFIIGPMGIEMALRPLFLFVLAFALGSVLATTRGGDFRVESEVYLGSDTEPVFETLTLFAGDVVYDFALGDQSDRTESKEVTVLNKRLGRIVLLDAKRKIQTTLTTRELAKFTAAIRKRATDEPNSGLFSPVFTVAYEEAGRQITMTSDELTYRAKGVSPKDPTAAKRYSNFADWYARLNATRGNVPPFGRIELNRVLAEKGLLPLEIERTTVLNRKKTAAHSKHSVIWTLSNTDRRRIDLAGQMMANLRPVSLKEYWGIKTEVAAKQ